VTRRILTVVANGGTPYAKLTYEGAALPTPGTGKTISILRSHLSVNYYVNPLSKSEQASQLAAISQTCGNRRVLHFWPDIVEQITGTDSQGNDVKEYLPSYFAAAAEFGRDAVLRPERSSTGVALGGFTGLQHSNTYFTRSQLNTIAGGGWAIFEQRVEGAAVTMRHLLTTDMSTVKTQEFSITKNIDNMAKVTRVSLEPLLNDDNGRVNITKQFLGNLAFPVQALCEQFKGKEQIVQTEGVPAYTILSIRQDPTKIDLILIDENLNVPAPANNMTVTFVI
jgi:hypothetical protein